jgi:hypothetical protein
MMYEEIDLTPSSRSACVCVCVCGDWLAMNYSTPPLTAARTFIRALKGFQIKWSFLIIVTTTNTVIKRYFAERSCKNELSAVLCPYLLILCRLIVPVLLTPNLPKIPICRQTWPALLHTKYCGGIGVLPVSTYCTRPVPYKYQVRVPVAYHTCVIPLSIITVLVVTFCFAWTRSDLW